MCIFTYLYIYAFYFTGFLNAGLRVSEWVEVLLVVPSVGFGDGDRVQICLGLGGSVQMEHSQSKINTGVPKIKKEMY